MGKNYIISGEIHVRDVKGLREMRLWLIKMSIGDKPIILCIDETGDEKKGTATLLRSQTIHW